MSDVYLDGEKELLLDVVNACVLLSPIMVEDAASAAFFLAIFAHEGGNVEALEQLLKNHLGEERYNKAFQAMTESITQYMNNRTMELPEGG
jgi:hypothetical protein